MKPFISIGICFVLLTSLLLVGCTTEVEKSIESEQRELDKSQQLFSDKEDYVEEKGIIVDRIKFGDYKSHGEIIKNKITKTARVEMSIYLEDDEEYAEIFDEKVAMAPFLIEMSCGFITLAFFNATALEEAFREGNLTLESSTEDEENPLEGYTVEKVHIEFFDFEDKTKIAECTATGLTEKDTQIKFFREYEEEDTEIE